MRSAKQVHKLLKSSRQSSRLLKRVEHGRQLTQDLRPLLPSSLADYCQVGDLNGQTLTIVTTSPVWAAKLRYLQAALLKAFPTLSNLSQVTEIRIKISNLPVDRQNPAAGRKAHMSPQSAEAIRQAAEGIEDPALRESLLKLSRHGKVNDPS